MGEEQIREIRQLVVRDESGRIVDVGLMNGKCYTKSLERGRLWVLHRDTGRVLPLEPEHRLVGIRDMNRWYEAVISPAETQEKGSYGAGRQGTAEALRTDFPEHDEEFFGIPAAERRGKPIEAPITSAPTGQSLEDERYGTSSTAETESFKPAEFSEAHQGSENLAATQSVQGTEAPRPQRAESFESHEAAANFLEKLENLVRERHATMPEGSYTTHLFASGAEKIRKKTGEEAVELILASTPEEILFEASDLMYHLCVLLVSEGLSFRQVFALLEERHTAG